MVTGTKAPPRVAHEGEKVHVVIDTTRALVNPCRLTLFVRPHGAFIATHHFSEVLEARETRPPREAAADARRYVIEWTVKLTGPGEAPPVSGLRERSEVTFEVSDAQNVMVKPRGGGAVVEPGEEDPDAAAFLTVAGIGVTDRAELRALMLHEHHDEAGAFDDRRLRAFLGRLHPTQRSLLLNYPLREGRPRLVAFVTLTPEDRQKLLGGDFCRKKPGPIQADAYFTVFRCAGPGDVQVVLHTEYLLVNELNGPTKGLRARADRRAAARPRRYCLGSALMDEENHGVPYMRVFSPPDEGPDDERSLDAMCDAGGTCNSIHGTINTWGCWALFRNFNWPTRYYVPFEQAYRAWRARNGQVDPERNRALTQRDLVAAMDPGEAAPYDASFESWLKFLAYDANLAYLRMLDDLFGLKHNHFEWRSTGGHDATGRSCQGRPSSTAVPPPRTEQEAAAQRTLPPTAYTIDPALPTWGPTVFGDGPFDFVRGKKETLRGRRVWRAENLAAASYADLFVYAESEEPFSRPEASSA